MPRWRNLAAALVLGTSAVRRESSSLSLGTEPKSHCMELYNMAREKIAILRSKGFVVDCFSFRKSEHEPMGKATEDCDVAIDVRVHPGRRIPRVGQDANVRDPYNDGSREIVRLKFGLRVAVAA